MFVLVHSPLVGPDCWGPVAEELRSRGFAAMVPEMSDDGEPGESFWRRQVTSLARSIDAGGAGPVVLAGHSGAGALLPMLGATIARPLAGYLFVDAGIHVDGASRLEMMAREDSDFAREFRGFLDGGGHFPTWTADELTEIVPDRERRETLVAGLRPRGIAFFAESIPVPAGWPDAPCGYLQFSESYDEPVRRASEAGWPVARLDNGHFGMLVDPARVATLLLRLAAEIDAE